MTGAQPLPKSFELFNRLAYVQFDEIETAREIARELEVLNKTNPSDFLTRVALSEAYVYCGYRQKAVQQIQAAYTLRRGQDPAGLQRLALILTFIGDRPRTLELVEELENASLNDQQNHSQIAAWAGAIGLLDRLARTASNAGQMSLAEEFLKVFDNLGGRNLVSKHQEIVIAIMKDIQVGVQFSMVPSESGEIICVNSMLFDSSIAKRRDLERSIKDTLRKEFGTALENKIFNIVTAAPTPLLPFRLVPALERS